MLLVDVFQTGRAKAERNLKGKFILAFNPSDDA
jgi:hypothetical protein